MSGVGTIPLTVAEERGASGDWNPFVLRQAGATACHLVEWRSIIEEVFAHECLYWGARQCDGALEGVLPLVRVRSRLFGHFLVSMPYLNYGGPLGSASAIQALTEAAATRAREDGARLLELRSAIPLPVDLPVSHRKVTVVLDLPDDPDRLLAGFPSKLRSQVRRPDKEGVTYRFGPDQCEPFYAVFARHMRDLGTPVMPRAFFTRVRDRLGPAVWFGCAWKDGVPVAGGAGFRFGDEFEMTWASSLMAYNRIAPNMGLYLAFMREAITAGARRFNFGRCTPGSGTHRFKRQWGGEDVPLWWYQVTRDGEPAATPSPSDGPYALGPRIWRRLPLSVATWLGPQIVRFIP